MQIVIDIPDEMYKKIKDLDIYANVGRKNGKTFIYMLIEAIKNGTPLPKDHGRLIEADKED